MIATLELVVSFHSLIIYLNVVKNFQIFTTNARKSTYTAYKIDPYYLFCYAVLGSTIYQYD